MNIMPLPVAASSHGLTAALARSATPTSKSCKARKQEFQDPAAMLFGRTEQITVPSFHTAGKIPDYATTFPVAVERDLTSQTLPRAGSLTSATPDSTGPYSEVAGEELL
jgi:hypothetical protein